MTNIEITFTNLHSGDVISWDVYDMNVVKLTDLGAYINRLRVRYPTTPWEMRDTSAPATTKIFSV